MSTNPSEPPVVAIVDAYSTARYLAPLFHEKGYRCVHVQSTPVIPTVYERTFRPEDFSALLVHDGDVPRTLDALADHSPTALLVGIESGVELADTLSERLGLRTNGTALSSARRDKHLMSEAVRKAGVPVARQALVHDRDALMDWYRGLGGRVVLKPLMSAGNDGVFFCDGETEVLKAFDSLIGSESALNHRNTRILAQEYLWGSEYYVNTVSLDGRHHVCDVWKTQHLNVNGVRDLLGGSVLMRRRGREQDPLVEYTFSVLDALGVRNGPAHTELKLTPEGPRLIETGARVCGADLPVLTRAAIGESQLEWTAHCYADPEYFLRHHTTDYRIRQHATCVNMVSPVSGTLAGYPRMDDLRGLQSFHDVLLRVPPGSPLSTTVNDFTYPMLVHLLHGVEGVVEHDYMTARQLDGEGFYDVV